LAGVFFEMQYCHAELGSASLRHPHHTADTRVMLNWFF
jgi:hypothetical protein